MLTTVSAPLTRDPIWRRADYRLATYISDAAWTDVEALIAHPATRSMADQLYRALGSIGANIAEGYSRASGPDRVRFYEYALGSARESREWYRKARHVLGDATISDRCNVLEQIVRLLVTAIRAERKERTIPSRAPTERSRGTRGE